MTDFNNQCCGTCVFWIQKELKGHEENKETGECHRYPPQMFVTLQQSGIQIQGRTTAQQTVSQSFPKILGTERGCGEYIRDENKVALIDQQLEE